MDLLQRPLSELPLPDEFRQTSADLGFTCLADILSLSPQELTQKCSYQWLRP